MFKERLLSGIVLMIVAVSVFIFGGPVLALVLTAISIIGFLELTKVLAGLDQRKNLTPLEWVGLVGILVFYGVLLGTKMLGWPVIYLMMTMVAEILAFLFAYVFGFSHITADQVASAAFAFLYAPVMLSFVYQTRMLDQYGKYMVWLILISSWGCDTCAYCVGKLIGKKKIFPVLSPKKSLEGCIGGVLGAALIGWLYGFFYVEKMTESAGISVAIAIICAVGAVMSMVGDLAASAIKRNKGIKDYGKLIPGHGGIMDRFDSMIVTAPATFLLSLLLL